MGETLAAHVARAITAARQRIAGSLKFRFECSPLLTNSMTLSRG
jgi:hypothetical protein